ncbi:hypothetical protein BC628DRAFT_1137465 [Trametes gibbosa]|nr:hypothetical protein BC628DRAFT_1137465 [Trametes gibbosa]
MWHPRPVYFMAVREGHDLPRSRPRLHPLALQYPSTGRRVAGPAARVIVLDLISISPAPSLTRVAARNEPRRRSCELGGRSSTMEAAVRPRFGMRDAAFRAFGVRGHGCRRGTRVPERREKLPSGTSQDGVPGSAARASAVVNGTNYHHSEADAVCPG